MQLLLREEVEAFPDLLPRKVVELCRVLQIYRTAESQNHVVVLSMYLVHHAPSLFALGDGFSRPVRDGAPIAHTRRSRCQLHDDAISQD
jgi:hypothetical protein